LYKTNILNEVWIATQISSTGGCIKVLVFVVVTFLKNTFQEWKLLQLSMKLFNAVQYF